MQAIQVMPNPKALYRRAEAHMRDCSFQAAANARRGIKLDPSSSQLRTLLERIRVRTCTIDGLSAGVIHQAERSQAASLLYYCSASIGRHRCGKLEDVPRKFWMFIKN